MIWRLIPIVKQTALPDPKGTCSGQLSERGVNMALVKIGSTCNSYSLTCSLNLYIIDTEISDPNWGPLLDHITYHTKHKESRKAKKSQNPKEKQKG